MSKHIADNLILHELDKSSHMKYDTSLSKQIEVIIIEEVDLTEVGTDILTLRVSERSLRRENGTGRII